MLYETNNRVDESDMIGGMRPGESRLWAHVLLTYLVDFIEKKPNIFQEALYDFREAIEIGDLKTISEMALVNYDNYLALCDAKLKLKKN